jgi:hypothetical protein
VISQKSYAELVIDLTPEPMSSDHPSEALCTTPSYKHSHTHTYIWKEGEGKSKRKKAVDLFCTRTLCYSQQKQVENTWGSGKQGKKM